MHRTFQPSNKTVVFEATPRGRGAVATVLVNGRNAGSIVSQFFHPISGKELREYALKRIVFGRWVQLDAHEDVVVCRQSEELVEVNCHGGRAAAESIIASLTSAGCGYGAWQDAVRLVEDDPTSADAREALAYARTERVASILLDQYRGAFRREVEQIIQLLKTQHLADARSRLSRLERYAPLGLHLARPWKVVLAGRPNVGKSSLINAIVGYERSIVFDQPGTTRDVVTAETAINGWPVQLADTAGVRTSNDTLEARGVSLARRQMDEADLVILVFDAHQRWTEEDQALKEDAPSALVVHNKCDLDVIDEKRPAGICTSAKRGEGISELMSEIITRLIPHEPRPGSAVPICTEQIEIIQRVVSILEAQQNVDEAAELLRDLGAGFEIE